ncbi:eukaryotic translation initiation factor 4E transporter-like isoform X2 [Pelodiscus sinensis]|uniref:eukaryotic translation initiation factor 4E transporter-like isoform X2 n=1 Tax=Pelodiscus sinensis TaxID=13735 RepID=UPI003F6C83EF
MMQMIEDVLGEGSVSASRFSRWFSNPSSGSHSSSLRSTPHEELERLAGLEQAILSPGQNSGSYFAPIPLEDHSENKVDILEMLQKAKVDLKPLLSSLSANKEKLRESTHSGVVLSVEEVEAGLKGLKMDQEERITIPFMAEQMEALNVAGSRPLKDGDMSAFNKLVSSMKASGTLPSQPKLNELLGPLIARPTSSNVLSGLIGGLEPASSLLSQRAPSPLISQVFPTQAASADYLHHRIPSPIGFGPSSQQLLHDPFQGMQKSIGPVAAQMSPLGMQQAALEGLALPHDLAIRAANFYQPDFVKLQMDKSRGGFRNRQQQVTKSPAPGHRGNVSSPAPAASITSMLSPSFTPTSVIRKMYESKEKNEEPVYGKVKSSDSKDEGQRTNEGMDLSLVQGISTPILGQPFYPTASHHLLNPRLGTPLQLAMIQQHLQRSVLHSPASGAQGPAVGVQNVASRTGLPHVSSQLDHCTNQRSDSPIGLAKWFGSDVLQQTLPSMPSKVISVDELEYRQ